MKEDFIKGIHLAVKRGYLTKQEGVVAIKNMIEAENYGARYTTIIQQMPALDNRFRGF
jgi:hypothetical protein